MSEISVCGLDCSACEVFQMDCQGCRRCRGKAPWLTDVDPDLEVCPLYACPVQEKGFRDCGECPDLPCEKYYVLQDPSLSFEEHEEGIEARVHRLLGE